MICIEAQCVVKQSCPRAAIEEPVRVHPVDAKDVSRLTETRSRGET